MDCELCEKRLVDLLYDELDASSAAEVRAHLEGCEACRHAMDKLESGRAFARKLELAPAPSMAKVLAAAREQAATNRAARDRPEPTHEPEVPRERPVEESPLTRVLRWLGAVAMGPQLGVATVLLLVVGIGLWYLPQLGDGERGREIALLEPEPGSTGETTTLVPAEPLQLAHDPRTGRVVSVTAEDEAPAPRPPSEPAQPRRPDRPPAEAPELELAAAEQTVPAEEPGPGGVEADALPELTTAAGSYEGGALPPVAAAPAPPATTPAAPRAEVRVERLGLDDVPAPAAADGETLAATALHAQARSLSSAGRCAEAVARYDQLVARYPDYPQGAQASLESADCLRRLGRASAARVALERASRSGVPTVAGAARRGLVELDAQARAAEEVPAAAATSH
jgi:hypothetical protein